jgi:hypothetical protein
LTADQTGFVTVTLTQKFGRFFPARCGIRAYLPVGRVATPIMEDCLYSNELLMKVNSYSLMTQDLFEKDKERNVL